MGTEPRAYTLDYTPAFFAVWGREEERERGREGERERFVWVRKSGVLLCHFLPFWDRSLTELGARLTLSKSSDPLTSACRTVLWMWAFPQVLGIWTQVFIPMQHVISSAEPSPHPWSFQKWSLQGVYLAWPWSFDPPASVSWVTEITGFLHSVKRFFSSPCILGIYNYQLTIYVWVYFRAVFSSIGHIYA